MEELVQKAEKLRAEIDSSVEMPRIERNLKQLAEVGRELWSRTSYQTSRDSCDIRASVMLGSMGYDLQKVSQHLESLSTCRKLTTTETLGAKEAADIQSFLRAERENAVLSVVDEVKRSTFDTLDRHYWNYSNGLWNEYRQQLQGLLACSGQAVGQESDSSLHDSSSQQHVSGSGTFLDASRRRMLSETPTHTPGLPCAAMSGDGADGILSEDIEYIVNQIAVNKERDNYEADVNKLFAQKDKHRKALELLISHLSPIVPEKKTPGSKRERLEMFALKVAEKFSSEGHSAGKELANVLYLLLDLITVFDYYHNQAYTDALDTIQRLNILPFRSTDIKPKVNQFGQFSEEIRRNIPDLLIATMNILYEQYKEAKLNAPQATSKFAMFTDSTNSDKLCSEIRTKARTLIHFAGKLPYKMPGDTCARLIQLEVTMN